MYDCDILISGGGIAGLTAAAAFGAAGFQVICVEPQLSSQQTDRGAADLRSTALLQPARHLLEGAGIWPALEPNTVPLEVMRICNATLGTEHRITQSQSFHAREISDLPFGWNVPNRVLKQVLTEHLATLPNVDHRQGLGATSLTTRLNAGYVRLSDGTRICTRLVLAADGRNSPMRQAAGIGVTIRRYGQKALVFTVTHEKPHENTSIEIHKTGGPFTLVPLADIAQSPASAVVWMDDGAAQVQRRSQTAAHFEQEISERSCHVLGALKLASERTIWPIIAQRSQAIIAQRLALIAEAAHVVPPIGAQGLNMSLADIQVLLESAIAQPEALGSAAMLASYSRKRMADIALRHAGIGVLNRVSQAHDSFGQNLRSMGLDHLHGSHFLRRNLMRLGLGA